MIARILFLLLAFSNAALAFTPKQFKELAHEMVNDLEKAYGSNYVDEGVIFDLSEYRKLIDRTNIDTRPEQIENISEILSADGEIIKIREVVDAVNYFPKEETILYFEQAWSDRFQKKKFEELKILIHHEFVPYFKKYADRQHIHSVKLRDIYQGSLSFEKLKPGFYEILNLNDPTFSALDSYYYCRENEIKHLTPKKDSSKTFLQNINALTFCNSNHQLLTSLPSFEIPISTRYRVGSVC